MNSGEQITIIGGGLAGLALGIALRRHDVPVTLIEARDYPRHTVCGEFICGRGTGVLRELGLYDELLGAGAVEARTVSLFFRRGQPLNMALPAAALCVPRHTLDTLLARDFERSGGDLRLKSRFAASYDQSGIVRASGRRRGESGSSELWFGVKAHFTGVTLSADLEMHLVPGGYVGLCRHGDGSVNACGLFRQHAKRARRGNEQGLDLLKGPESSLLRKRMFGGQLIPGTFCAVAGLDLAPGVGERTSECRIGDALTMIPPLTGNGMSMALESAAIAANPLAGYSQGEMEWGRAQRSIATACEQTFGRRLRWARLLHAAVFTRFQSALACLAIQWPTLPNAFYTRTR